MRKDDEHKHGASEGEVGRGEARPKADRRGVGASEAGKREAGKAKARKSKADAGGKTATSKTANGKTATSKTANGKTAAGKTAVGKVGAADRIGASTGGDTAADTSGPRVRSVPDPRLSRSLEYGVAILETFSAEHRELGIARLSDIVGISRSTTHRYATTLVALGYLEQNSKRKYRLSTRAADPGNAAIAAVRRDIHARVVLEELREQTGHTVSMGVLDRARVTYVHRLFGHRAGQYAIDANLGVGASVPVYCTALGKVLLASLSDAERRELLAGLRLTRHGPNTILNKRALAAELDGISPRGIVLSDEEAVHGARSIAVLVPRPSGKHPLAIDVTVPSAAYTVEQLTKKVGSRLKRAARLISGE
jgi:DNA-binding IclR family transcriptional regulator